MFNISRSYEAKQILGEGAYGVVASAVHKPTGLTVAIKKIKFLTKPLVCLRTIRELKLLNFFRNHENIIGFYDVQRPGDLSTFNEVYIIQEYMPTDLHRLNHSLELLDQHMQYFAYQIFRGLKSIHSANVIHRDLKPSNILVNYNCDVKICDFGLARIVGSENSQAESKLTEYVATRWYRAPEIMLLLLLYSTAVDIWAIGCILAELFLGYPLFPGRDYKHQLYLILQYLGTPCQKDLDNVKLPRAREYIKLLPSTRAVNVPAFFNNHPRRVQRYGKIPVNAWGIDLMTKLLTFDPEERITASDAMKHKYLEEYHDPTDEPEANVKLQEDYFDLKEKSDLKMDSLKEYLYEEILEMSTLYR